MSGFGRPASRPARAAWLKWSVVTGVVGVSTLVFGMPAGAATGDSVTIDHSPRLTIRASQRLSVESTAAATCALGLTERTVTVTLTGPSGSHSSTSTLASTAEPCNQTVHLHPQFASPSRNGSYTVTLRNGAASRTTSATLAAVIPPAQPTGFAVAADHTEATFTWTANPEPDIVAYFITTPSGQLVKPVRVAAVCGTGSTCSTRDDLGPTAAGRTESFVIHAIRCGISCNEHIAGPDSAQVSARFTARTPPPVPPPAPVVTGPAPVQSAPPSTTTSEPPVSPTAPAGSSAPAGGQSSQPAPVGSSSAPVTGTSSAPAGVSPSATASGQAGASSSGSSSSGGDWAVRGIAIVLVLITLALFVRALSQRAGNV